MSKPDTTETFEKEFNSKYGDKYINEINNFIYTKSNKKIINEIPKEKYENIFKDVYERPEKYENIFKSAKDQKICLKSQLSYLKIKR
jgi:hypothetical protein